LPCFSAFLKLTGIMRSFVLLVFLWFALVASGSEMAAGSAAPAKIRYPDSVAGLKQLCDDMFAAIKANDIPKAKAIGATLNLENPEAWFKKTFGDEAGPRLAAAHAELGDLTQIGGFFAGSMEKGRTDVIVERFDNGDDQNATTFQSEALKAMKVPVALYSVRFVKPGEKKGFHFHSLAYVDGNFKVLGEMKKLNPKPMTPQLEAVCSLRLKDAKIFLKTGKLPD
jgi:hypothetical protein